MCVELFFINNLLMDFSLCAAVARSFGCFRLNRVTLAAVLGAIYAVIARAFPFAAAPPFQLMLLIPVSMLTAGRAPLSMTLAAALSLPTAALASGACANCIGITGFGVALLPLPALLTLAPRVRRSLLASMPATFEARCCGATVRFPACVDTGNRLTEPFSGQPVLIASASLLKPILPADGYRLVPYGSVGGHGAIPCFRPDAFYILQNGRRRRAPEIWIAVFPERLPGPFQALAPAIFALYF
ncbi:MAG: sigma-E processing peptidase SpoIIGA [bacterium]